MAQPAMMVRLAPQDCLWELIAPTEMMVLEPMVQLAWKELMLFEPLEQAVRLVEQERLRELMAQTETMVLEPMVQLA
jgi:hypothetical protein